MKTIKEASKDPSKSQPQSRIVAKKEVPQKAQDAQNAHEFTNTGVAAIATVQGQNANKQINVALFCGGRGSASLISEFLRWPQVHLSLIVNGYDDGLSTGHLRDLVPNMLGPSDFRKNLSRLIDLHSDQQYALQKLLEYRFSDGFGSTEIGMFEDYVEHPSSSKKLPAPLDSMMQELHPKIKQIILDHLRSMFKYHRDRQQALDYSDCSFGNLVFAGAYLKANANFNASVKSLTDLFRSSADVINITQGENRVLVALKADGQVLTRESEVVGPQSASPIMDIFLLESSLDAPTLDRLAGLPVTEKSELLRSLEAPVHISPEAAHVLQEADVIVYGPGTQFSSLLPSYKTIGIAHAIETSRARVKIFVSNIEEDHDIQGKTASALMDTALQMLGDPENSKRCITHILCNEPRSGNFAAVPPVSKSSAASSSEISRGKRISLGNIRSFAYKNATVVLDRFENKVKPGTHTGHEVVHRVIELYEASLKRSGLRTLEIYVDLRDRSRAVSQLLQEFVDIPWTTDFEHVTLTINRLGETKTTSGNAEKAADETQFPDYATLQTAEFSGLFTEVDALSNWLKEGETDYLVTLTGDGEYRLRDILIGIQLLRLSLFGALYGSRTQSRHQFRTALDSAYGESPLLMFLSFLGAFFFTAVFGLLFRQIYSDPFTGFRIYRRSKMSSQFIADLQKRRSVPSSTVTRLLLKHRIEIAEIPVVYRTFCGFTKPGWRIRRALKNLAGLIG